MGKKCKSVPINKGLYNKIKQNIKSHSKVWPSAYASGRLVRTYKSKGGKYRCSFGDLNDWFEEEWVNVCKPKGKSYARCGRKKSSWKNYPYCRPLKRINSQTPKTVKELGKAKIKQMCNKKRKNPRKKQFLKFGNNNIFGDNIINKNNFMDKRQTCGFGNNLSATNSNLDTFYKNGTADSLNLTNDIGSCLGTYYDKNVTRFGKKFIQEANRKAIKKGTVGSFTRWCKSKGYPKVTTSCIKLGKQSSKLNIRRKAIFAQNIRSKKRNYAFGNSENENENNLMENENNLMENEKMEILPVLKSRKKRKTTKRRKKRNNFNSDIKYLKSL